MYSFKYFNIYKINIKNGNICNYFKLKLNIIYIYGSNVCIVM